MKEEPLKLIEEHAGEITEFGVRRLGIFGSFARGDHTDESDVDVYVEFRPGMKNYDNLCNLYFYLKDLLARPIDLVTKESLSQRKAEVILPTVRYAFLNS